MPLEKGKSKRSFEKNVSTETRALEARGKSPKKAVKQALAVSYAERRKKK